MRKLSGWQRIGIVVSVIWFVGFAGYVVAHRQDDALYDKLRVPGAEGLQRDVALLDFCYVRRGARTKTTGILKQIFKMLE